MSKSFEVYVIPEYSFPKTLPGLTDQQKYGHLVELTLNRGTLQGKIEMDEQEFSSLLERIDALSGGGGFFSVLSFNNSPYNLLGNYGDCPNFGYFSPVMAADMQIALKRNRKAIDSNSHDPRMTFIFNLYDLASLNASQHHHAIAIVHD